MRNERFGWIAGLLVAAAAGLAAACDDAASTASGGAAGTSTSIVTTASTSTGAPGCDGLGTFAGDPCGPCIESMCCAELAAAVEPSTDPELGACANEKCNVACFPPPVAPFPIACSVAAPAPAMGACVQLGGANQCNPVTNEGCTAVGAACDQNADGFECYADGNVHELCEACGAASADGKFCKAGMTCIAACMRYCCEDADCGSGKCTKTVDGKPLFANAPALGGCEDSGTTTSSSVSSSSSASSSSTGP